MDMAESYSDADKVYLHTQYDVVGESLTPQEEKLVLFAFRGVPIHIAAKNVGMSVEQADEAMASPTAQQLTSIMRERESKNIEVTRDRLNMMLFDAHARSATATEEIMAIRELGKMNDLYADNKGRMAGGAQVNINVSNVRQIERASDQQLL